MTVTEGSGGGGGEMSVATTDKKKKKPDLSLEWTDLRIEIKVCSKDIPEEDQAFVQYFPKVAANLLSSACIQERKEDRREQGRRLHSARPKSGHTLTDLLESNQDVNNRRTGSSAGSDIEPKTEAAVKSEDGVDDDDNPVDLRKLIHLPSGEKKCHICGKIFCDSSRIKRHLLSHSGKKPYLCPLCGWGFYQKCNMDRHLASHAKEGEGEPCPHCNNWFTTKSVLSLHMRDAHNDRLPTKKELGSKLRQQLNGSSNTEGDQPNSTDQDDMDLADMYDDSETIPPGGSERAVFPAATPEQRKAAAEQLKVIERLTKKQLICTVCGKSFVKKTNLKHHLMLHRGEKPWKCSICDWRFVQKCNLKRHLESHESGSFICPSCDVRFSSKAAVTHHLLRAHQGQVLENMLTMGTPKTKKKVGPNEEEEEQEIPAPYTLPMQEKKPAVAATPSPAKTPAMNWWKHLDDDNEEKKPIVASDSSSTPIKREQEENTAAEEQSKPETSKPLVPLPDAGSPGNKRKVFKCSKCFKMFLSMDHLQKHMQVHNAGVKPYACPVCGCRFHLLHNMKRHIVTHEEQGDIEAGTAEGLLKAAEATTGKQPGQTQLGGQKRTPSAGTTAIAAVGRGTSVDGKGNMKCHVCGKWFPSAANLKAHMEYHKREKPHACSVCGWQFKQIQNLKRHMHTHTGIKPFACDFCEKSYTDNYSLKQHVAKVHPDVASSLPSMQVNPRRRIDQGGEEFESMVQEMKVSQKETSMQAAQSQFVEQTFGGDLPEGVETVTYPEEEEAEEEELSMDTSDPEEQLRIEEEDLDDQLDLQLQDDPVVQEAADDDEESIVGLEDGESGIASSQVQITEIS